MDLGFSSAGFNLVLSSDIDKHSCETLLKNQKKQHYVRVHPVACEDIRNLTYKRKKNLSGTSDIDFIIGGPPCQAFSVFGRRKGLEDPRGELVFEYVRIVQETEPAGFLFENVAGLKTIHEGNLYRQLLDILSINGKYTVTAHEYETADFGVPQNRRRIFFIGVRSGSSVPVLAPTHADTSSLDSLCGLRPYNTVKSALSGLSKPVIDWNAHAHPNWS